MTLRIWSFVSVFMIFLAAFLFLHTVQPTSAFVEILSLVPIDCGSLAPTSTTSDLIVMFESGIKLIIYFTFNMSEIPLGASLQSVRLKVKTDAVGTPAWVSAFCFPNHWINYSWENYTSWKEIRSAPHSIGSKLITTYGTWYSYDFSSENKGFLVLSMKTGFLTVELESILYGVDQPSLIIFDNDAKLEVSYVRDIGDPVIGNIKIQPSQPTPEEDAIVEVTATDSMSGVKEVCLYYSINNTSVWNKISMIPTSNSVYRAVIPRQTEGTKVVYYFEALDIANNMAQTSNYSYIAVNTDMSGTYFLIGSFTVAIILVISLGYYVTKRKTRPPRIAESKK